MQACVHSNVHARAHTHRHTHTHTLLGVRFQVSLGGAAEWALGLESNVLFPG